MVLNDGRELQSKAKEAQTTPYYEEEFTELLEIMRGSRAYSKVCHNASNYGAYALTAKDPGEQALIYGSGLCVTLKNHGESALIRGSGLKTAFLKAINHSNGCASLALQTF